MIDPKALLLLEVKMWFAGNSALMNLTVVEQLSEIWRVKQRVASTASAIKVWTIHVYFIAHSLSAINADKSSLPPKKKTYFI